MRFFSAYNPLINNGLYIFGAHTCFLCVLSVEKCVFVLLGSLHITSTLTINNPQGEFMDGSADWLVVQRYSSHSTFETPMLALPFVVVDTVRRALLRKSEKYQPRILRILNRTFVYEKAHTYTCIADAIIDSQGFTVTSRQTFRWKRADPYLLSKS